MISKCHIIGLCVALFCVVSQNKAGNILFKHLNRNNGLLHDNVTCVTQDENRYIWIGTHRGINRYDGYSVTSHIVDKGKLHSSFYNKIFDIKPYRKWLWIISEGGLLCFDTATNRFEEFDMEGDVDFRSLTGFKEVYVDHSGRVWLMAEGIAYAAVISEAAGKIKLNGCYIDGKSCVENSNRNIPRVAEDDKGNIYISGLSRFNIYRSDMNGDVKSVGTMPAINSSSILRAKFYEGKLWIAYSNKVDVFENGEFKTTFPFPKSSVSGVVVQSDNIWISATEGLIRIPTSKIGGQNKWIFYLHSTLDPYSICSNHQNSIFLDGDNNIWITTWGAGLSYADTRPSMFNVIKFQSDDSLNGSSDDFVSAIHDDNHGKLYVGTKFGGIKELDRTTMSVMRRLTPPGFKTIARSICSDDRYIYAAESNYIRCIDKKSGENFVVYPIEKSHIFDVQTDRNGFLWAASRRGVVRLSIIDKAIVSKQVFSTDQNTANLIFSDMVNFIYSDKDKNEILLGTSSGVNRLILDSNSDVVRAVTYMAKEDDPSTLSSNYTWAIDKYNDSVYWVGTMGSGLNRMVIRDRGDVYDYMAESFGMENGAPSNDIECLQVDRYGFVWCGGRYLSRLDPNTGLFNVFYESDGLQSYMFGTGSSCKGVDGMLYFGGLKGMNYFMPDISHDTTRYNVYFSQFTIDSRPIALNRKIELKYPDRSFEAAITSLTYSRQQHINYRYRLVNYDDGKWRYISPGSLPEITFRQLPYGKYRLVVQAGIWNRWNGEPSYLDIVVRPPWWSSTTAYIIYLLAILLVLYLLFRYVMQWINMKNVILMQNERDKHREELMRMKMQFFTNVSHEFKTPLTLINSAVMGIEQEDKIKTDNKFLNIIKRNNRKLLNLVNELMDFQRSDLNASKLRTTHVDVTDIIRQIYDEFHYWAFKAGIDMTIKMEEESIYMWIDEEHFGKILSNLLSNAIKYTPSGGKIKIDVSQGKVEDLIPAFGNSYYPLNNGHQGGQLIIRVKDSGIGITEASLPMIFERFGQVESKRSKHLGSGIGLALVQSLMKMHKGSMIVSSECNAGSEFIISFILSDSYLENTQKYHDNTFELSGYLADYGMEMEEVGIKYEPGSEVDRGKFTLLLVDDNREILLMLKEHFAKHYSIITAVDGTEALAMCNEHAPDIIVSDVMMPGMDGIELCRRLKNQLSTCFIPIILLTARSMEEQHIEGVESGADYYISKPFNMQLLAATIKTLLNRSNFFKSGIAGDNNAGILLRRDAIEERHKKFFDKLITLVEDNFMNSDFSVNHLSMELGISRSGLYSMVKNNAGVTLGDFIRDIRLNKAAELLRTTDMSISEVVYATGISNPAYFARIFKARFGLSPSEYVKKL